MVKLIEAKASNAALVASQPLVAVFIGGSSGIGLQTFKELAQTHGKTGKGLRAYIVGRDIKGVEGVISECKTACPSGQFIFVQAKDLALMRDVDAVSAELMRIEQEQSVKKGGGKARIDILIQCQAIHKPWDPRKETSEGLDTFMSLLYYSRMRFITRLLPLLLASSLPARVISVFGPHRDTNFIPDDLSLRDPKNYGFMNAGCHAAYFTTFFFEHLAQQHPGLLSLIHYFPGLVIHSGFQDPTFPFWFRSLFKYGAPLLRLAPLCISEEESGHRTLLCASEKRFVARGKAGMRDEVAESSDGVRGGGAYRVNWDSGMIAVGKQYGKMREEGWKERCVEHTLKAWEEIERKGVFTG